MNNLAGHEVTQDGFRSKPVAPLWSRRHVLGQCCLLAVARTAAAEAGVLAPPSSPAVLVVKGLIGRTNVAGEAHLDRELMEGFGAEKLRTWTPWTDGEVEFTGLPLRTLIEELEAGGTSIRARALNDYEVEIPVSDALTDHVLIAWSGDGVDFTRRGKGPFWIVYPWSDHPELDNRNTSQKSIWQLYELEFHED